MFTIVANFIVNWFFVSIVVNHGVLVAVDILLLLISPCLLLLFCTLPTITNSTFIFLSTLHQFSPISTPTSLPTPNSTHLTPNSFSTTPN